jgi:putative FmdB family regulatory protein
VPTYAYACTACDHRFEVQQSFSDAALTECPECTGRLRKLFNTVGIVFKGSGFYRTDSRSGTPAASGSGPADGASPDSSSSGSSSSDSSSSGSSSSTAGANGSSGSGAAAKPAGGKTSAAKGSRAPAA